MRVVACPHCGNHGVITTKIPRDVVVVWPCPNCQGFVVLFRNKVIPINREILEHGTPEQRKAHIADIVAEFLDANFFSVGMSPFVANPLERIEDEADESDGEEGHPSDAPNNTPISQEEFENWVRFELQKLDDPAYFKKYFG